MGTLQYPAHPPFSPMRSTVWFVLVLLLLMNCSLNRVKTPGKVCASSPYSTEKQTKNTLRGASKLHIQRQQTNGSLLPELGEASLPLPHSNGGLLKPLPGKHRHEEPGCSAQLQNSCRGRETWNITSSKENPRSGCHLNVIIRPDSIHTPDSSPRVSSLSVLNHMEQRKTSAVMTALMAPSGAPQILKDIWTLLSGAHRLEQTKAADNFKGRE